MRIKVIKFQARDGCIITIFCKTGVLLKEEGKKRRWNGPAVHHRRLCVICFGCVFLMGWALPQLNLVLLAGFYRYASITAEAHSSRDVEMNVQARRMYSSPLFIIMGLPLGAESFHAYFFKLDNRQVLFRHNTLPCPLALIGSTNVVSQLSFSNLTITPDQLLLKIIMQSSQRWQRWLFLIIYNGAV